MHCVVPAFAIHTAKEEQELRVHFQQVRKSDVTAKKTDIFSTVDRWIELAECFLKLVPAQWVGC